MWQWHRWAIAFLGGNSHMHLVVQAAREDASSGNHKPCRMCYLPSAVCSTLCVVQGGQSWNKTRRNVAEVKLPLKFLLNVQHRREQVDTDYDETFCFLCLAFLNISWWLWFPPPLQYQRVSRLNVIQFGHLNTILFNLLFSLPSCLPFLDNVLLSDAAPTQYCPCLNMPEGKWAECPVNFIAAENLAELFTLCSWHLPVAGSGKGQGPRSSNMSGSSEHCNVLKSISQLWWVPQIWNDLSSLFPWIHYRASFFVSLNLSRVPAWPHLCCTIECLENIDALSKQGNFLISYQVCSPVIGFGIFSILHLFPGESHTN